jgi:hypothetical protein
MVYIFTGQLPNKFNFLEVEMLYFPLLLASTLHYTTGDLPDYQVK